MSDNTVLNAGSGGDTFAADDIGGIKWQRIKLCWGVDGVAVDASATNPLPVIVAAGATNIAKAEDAVHADGDTGAFVLAVRTDTASQRAGTDGDYSPLITDSSGRLHVAEGGAALTSLQLIDNAISGAGFNITQLNGVNVTMGNGASGTGVQRVTIANDSTGILAAVTSLTQMNGQAISMGTGTRDAGTQRVTIATNDSLPVTNAGTFAVQAAQSGTWTVQPGNTANTTPWLVTGSGSAGTAASGVLTIQGIASMTPVQVQGAVASGAADSGNPNKIGGVYNSTLPTFTNGQRGDGQIGTRGSLSVQLYVPDSTAVYRAVADNVDGVTVSAANTAFVNCSRLYGFNGTSWDRARMDTTGGLWVQGAVASGSTSAGNPLLNGGRAATANPTAVTDGQAVRAMFDKLGKQVCVGSVRTLKGKQKTTITSSTAETTIVTAGASGVFQDVYGLIIANSSGTACNVTIKDATSGSTVVIMSVPAGETRGFMLTDSSAVPQATAANNWTATCSASVASIEITALYVSNI